MDGCITGMNWTTAASTYNKTLQLYCCTINPVYHVALVEFPNTYTISQSILSDTVDIASYVATAF